MIRSVLITDGDQRAALACTRSLAASGLHCYVVGKDDRTLSGSSRYCSGSARLPEPDQDPDGFLIGLRDRIEAWQCDALLPITEKSLRVVLPRAGELEGVLLPFPRPDVFARVSDKAQVLTAAQELGIHVPRQWQIHAHDDPKGGEVRGEVFPVAIKSTRSVTGPGQALPRAAVAFASDSEGLLSHLRSLPEEAYPVLVQERIIGTGAGVFLLVWEGRVVASVGHRRLREKPPSGGVSVVRESTLVDPVLLERSLALLSRMGWESGVAMVEFKIQDGSGCPYLMEINGRFWGSLQLAIDAGVDFPGLLIRCASGDVPDRPVVGLPHVITRWLLGDIDQLLMRLMKSRDALALPDSDPGRLRSTWEFLRDFRLGIRNEVLRLSDPGPFLAEGVAWVSALLPKKPSRRKRPNA